MCLTPRPIEARHEIKLSRPIDNKIKPQHKTTIYVKEKKVFKQISCIFKQNSATIYIAFIGYKKMKGLSIMSLIN